MKKISKTYRFLEEDITEMLNMGLTATEVFHIGIMTKKNIAPIQQQQAENNDKVEKLALKLDRYIRKYNKMKEILEGILGLKLDDFGN
jgi:hypothetical protein